MLPPTARHSPDRPTVPTVRQEHPLTALLTEPRLFRTGSIPSPASRFLCGHLLRSVSIRIGANPVASCDDPDLKIMILLPNGLHVHLRCVCTHTRREPQRSLQHQPPDALRVTSRIELRAMAQTRGVLTIPGVLR